MHLLRISPSNPHFSQFSSVFPSFSSFPILLSLTSFDSDAFRRRNNGVSAISLSKNRFRRVEFGKSRALEGEIQVSGEDSGENRALMETEDLGSNGVIFQQTLRLVECAMFAAVAGLAYFLSNSLAIENYFGCFFALPIVISSMRWGVAAGRKTMVATAILLLTLSGPVKACTYLVRAMGAVGYVLISSFLIRENILALITINIHASLTYMLAAIGVNTIPSMEAIYSIFGTLLLLNCGFFVFLLHILYAVFLSRLGMTISLRLPRWLQKAI